MITIWDTDFLQIYGGQPHLTNQIKFGIRKQGAGTVSCKTAIPSLSIARNWANNTRKSGWKTLTAMLTFCLTYVIVQTISAPARLPHRLRAQFQLPGKSSARRAGEYHKIRISRLPPKPTTLANINSEVLRPVATTCLPRYPTTVSRKRGEYFGRLC
ncbi:MAG: hypothetical protein IPJ82_11525 [Lewinellaceae bacterium]|nr:hypothetical protein [Lewinellaceae bacterium]